MAEKIKKAAGRLLNETANDCDVVLKSFSLGTVDVQCVGAFHRSSCCKAQRQECCHRMNVCGEKPNSKKGVNWMLGVLTLRAAMPEHGKKIQKFEEMGTSF